VRIRFLADFVFATVTSLLCLSIYHLKRATEKAQRQTAVLFALYMPLFARYQNGIITGSQAVRKHIAQHYSNRHTKILNI
jgi:hypothetical protein